MVCSPPLFVIDMHFYFDRQKTFIWSIHPSTLYHLPRFELQEQSKPTCADLCLSNNSSSSYETKLNKCLLPAGHAPNTLPRMCWSDGWITSTGSFWSALLILYLMECPEILQRKLTSSTCKYRLFWSQLKAPDCRWGKECRSLSGSALFSPQHITMESVRESFIRLSLICEQDPKILGQQLIPNPEWALYYFQAEDHDLEFGGALSCSFCFILVKQTLPCMWVSLKSCWQS